MKKNRLAINSVSTINAPLPECLAAYQEAGFRNVEFPLRHVREHLERGPTLSDVRRLLDAHGIACIGGFDRTVACFAPQAEREENHARHVANARLIAELGGTVMVAGTDGPPDLKAVRDPVGEMAKTFAALGRRIKGTGVTLCIEFNWSPIVKSLRTAAEIARRSRMSTVGVQFDPAHDHCTPSKFDQLTEENVALIRHVHVDDMADKPAEFSNCNSDRVLPGEGCLDLKALYRRIEQFGYRGFFSIEMFSEKLWKMPARKSARLMYNSLLPLCTR